MIVASLSAVYPRARMETAANGFGVCRQIKRDPDADGFLSKPFEADDVRGLLARRLGPRR